MVETEQIQLEDEDKLRLSYFKRVSHETAELAGILIDNYGSLQNALNAYKNNSNSSEQSSKISKLIEIEETFHKYKINGQNVVSLGELIKKFEPERDDTVRISRENLEKRLNKSE